MLTLGLPGGFAGRFKATAMPARGLDSLLPGAAVAPCNVGGLARAALTLRKCFAAAGIRAGRLYARCGRGLAVNARG